MSYNNPRDIIRDELDTYKEGIEYAKELGVPWTPDLIERMAVSSHIEASHHGYRGPGAEQTPSGQSDAPPEEPVRPQGNGSYGDYREKKHNPSGPSLGKMKGVMDAAADIEAHKLKIGIRDGLAEVKKNIIENFEPYWEFTPNLTSPKGRMTQGQVSWVIDYVKTEWGVD